ncbi:RNA-directed DNA polymerase, eukaryota, reverse transcriptase zinc-binding domain protein [Tanacetum coccineum]
MMVQALKDIGEDSAALTDSHSTPIITQPSSSKPQKKYIKSSARKEQATIKAQIRGDINVYLLKNMAGYKPQSAEEKKFMDEIHEKVFNIMRRLEGNRCYDKDPMRCLIRDENAREIILGAIEAISSSTEAQMIVEYKIDRRRKDGSTLRLIRAMSFKKITAVGRLVKREQSLLGWVEEGVLDKDYEESIVGISENYPHGRPISYLFVVLTLPKEILSSLPLYCLSLFKSPANVLSSLEGSRKGVWESIISANSAIEFTSVPFRNSFVRKVKSGDDICFWNDVWLDLGQCLKVQFPRLYGPEVHKDCRIKDRWVLDDDDNKGIFSINKLSKLIDKSILRTNIMPIKHKWNSWVPKKVNICVLRAINDRLPTLSNLESRGVQVASSHYVICNSSVESVDLCFLFFSIIYSVWRKIWSLQNFNKSSFTSLQDLLDFVPLSLLSPIVGKMFHGVSLVAFWVIWSWRNRILNADPTDRYSVRLEDILAKVKILSQLWILNKCHKKTSNWSRWVHNPACYLDE